MIRRRLLMLSPGILAPGLLGFAAAAWAQSPLVGLWTVSLGSDARPRHWQVQEVTGGTIRSQYGWPGETLGRATASLSQDGGRLRLRLVTGARSVIEAEQAGPGRFVGRFTQANGRTDTVTLTLGSPPAAAAQSPAPSGPTLVGLWTVMVEGDERHRSWLVRGVDGTAIRSKYGWREQEPTEIAGTVASEASGRTLRLVTQANSVIEAREEVTGRFTGRFTYRNGRSTGVTLMQESGETAAARQPTGGSRFIVYVGAPDCPFCHTFNTVHYRGEYERSPEGRKVPLRAITAYSYRNNRLATWPADLAGIPAQIRMEGAPLFLAVSGTTVVLQARGLSRFELDIRPLARRWAAEG